MADTGYGVTVTFQSGFFGEIIDLSFSGMSRTAVDTSHAATTNGAMTYIPSDLFDNGSVDVSINFDPDDTPPIDQAAESTTVTFPIPSGSSNGATAVFSGFMTDASVAVPIDDRMTLDATLKITGEVTWTDKS